MVLLIAAIAAALDETPDNVREVLSALLDVEHLTQLFDDEQIHAADPEAIVEALRQQLLK